jgi:hypothetical protein
LFRERVRGQLAEPRSDIEGAHGLRQTATSMQNVILSIEVQSETLKLSELSAWLGEPDAESSLDKGRELKRTKTFGRLWADFTCWRICYDPFPMSELEQQLQDLIARHSLALRKVQSIYGTRVERSLTFGVLFHGAHARLKFPVPADLHEHFEKIEVSSYPCSDEKVESA